MATFTNADLVKCWGQRSVGNRFKRELKVRKQTAIMHELSEIFWLKREQNHGL